MQALRLGIAFLTVSLGILTALIIAFSPEPLADHSYEERSHGGAEARFDILSEQRTNSCGGGKDYVAQLSADGTRIQGSCCSAMVLHAYEEQLEGLKQYSEYDIIPKDPYNVSASWADEMIRYGEETELTPDQQAVYDEAMESSDEGGPCCCKCWHWYAYEGLAEYLIINEDFSADQIAELWELSDACGGDHAH